MEKISKQFRQLRADLNDFASHLHRIIENLNAEITSEIEQQHQQTQKELSLTPLELVEEFCQKMQTVKYNLFVNISEKLYETIKKQIQAILKAKQREGMMMSTDSNKISRTVQGIGGRNKKSNQPYVVQYLKSANEGQRQAESANQRQSFSRQAMDGPYSADQMINNAGVKPVENVLGFKEQYRRQNQELVQDREKCVPFTRSNVNLNHSNHAGNHSFERIRTAQNGLNKHTESQIEEEKQIKKSDSLIESIPMQGLSHENVVFQRIQKDQSESNLANNLPRTRTNLSKSYYSPQRGQKAKNQKVQVLKKSEICQSLDKYIHKEAVQMLQRSSSKKNLSRKKSPTRANWFSSGAGSISRAEGTPLDQMGRKQQSNMSSGSPQKKGINVSQFDRIIEEKLGKVSKDQKTSPIFKYKL